MALTLKCEWCGKEFICYPSRFKNSKHHCCSKECMNNLQKQIRENSPDYLNCVCDICGKKFHIEPSQKMRYKHTFCSKECDAEYKRIRMSGENNHQYGLRKELNASWKGGKRVSSYGYYLIYMPEHPFCNGDGCVFEHRLVAEKYLLNDENSVIVNGKRYLSPEYAVHHIDENRLNNDVSNLKVMLKGEHVRLHNLTRKQERNDKGQFIAKE